MSTRLKLLWLGLVSCIGVAGFVEWLWRMGSEQAIAASIADEIKPGMSEADLLRVVGRPPGDYSSKPDARFLFRSMQGKRLHSLGWRTDWGYLSVTFDSDGKVNGSRFSSVR